MNLNKTENSACRDVFFLSVRKPIYETGLGKTIFGGEPRRCHCTQPLNIGKNKYSDFSSLSLFEQYKIKSLYFAYFCMF